MAKRFLSNIRINDAYTFPASDGTNNQVIKTDGSGNLSFGQLSADSASVMYKDTFTGDGSTTGFTLSNALNDEVQSNIYIDGVYQSKSTYSVSGTAITFSTAPLSGHEIEVISTTGINSGPTAIYTDTFTANGSATAFTLGQTVHSENQTIVFLNGVYQFKGTYTLSGTTLTLDTAPANGVSIEVMSIGSAYSGGDILYDHDFTSAGLMTTNGSGVYSITANNSANWNTAYGWGDHGLSAQDKTDISNLSGTNTGDQDLSSYATQSYVGTQISNLVDSSPATLNTLNELAAALGDDPNFATTTATSIGTKLPLAGGTLTGNLNAKNILFSTSALPAANNPGINLRDTNNEFYIQSGSAHIFNFIRYDNRNSMMNIESTGINVTGGGTFSGSVTTDKIIIDGASNSNVSQFALTRTDFSWGIFNETNLRFYVQSGNTTTPNGQVLEIATNGNATFSGSITSTGLNVNAGTYHKVIATFPATYTTNLQIGQQFNVNNDALTDTVTFAHTGTEAASDFIFTVAGNEKLKIQGNGNVTFPIGPDTNRDANSIKHASNGFLYIKGGAAGTSINDDGEDTRMILFNNGNIRFDAGTKDNAMIIEGSTGKVGIGTTSPQRPLHVNGTEGVARFTSTASGNNGFEVGIGVSSQAFLWLAENSHMEFATNNVERMRITSTGTIFMYGLGGYTSSNADVRYATSSKELYYQTSSKRYKTNIVNLENSLDKIDSLRPVRYVDINTKEPACGLIAEETVEIIPEVVFTKEIEGFDEPQVEGINYSDLVPFLIKSIQELKAEVELLKTQINN